MYRIQISIKKTKFFLNKFKVYCKFFYCAFLNYLLCDIYDYNNSKKIQAYNKIAYADLKEPWF